MLQDVRLALRSFQRRPAVASLIVLTLAIGIAASTTLFSIADAVLWHPLPFRDPQQLVAVRGYMPSQPDQRSVRLERIEAWTARSQILSACLPYTTESADIAFGVEPRGATIARLAPGLLTELGVTPVIGRDFTPADAGPGAAVAIVRRGLWTQLPQLADGTRTVAVAGTAHLVVGVLPDGFEFPVTRVTMFLPLDRSKRESLGQLLGRLRPEISFEQAQAFTIATSGGLAGGPPLAALRLAPFVSPLSSTRATLGVLLLGVAMLFTIAIVNATTLLLAEAVRRDGELALRAALGARPWRLARLLLTETLLLAAAAATLALLLARLLLAEVANSLSYLMVYQALRPIALDWRSVGFSIAIAIAAGSAVGLAVVARTGRRGVHPALARLDQRGGSASWTQRALIVCQLAITLVLLCCAGLLAHSGVRLARADPGFDPQHLLTVGVDLPRWRFPDGPATRLLLDRLRSEAAALPGVERATLSESIPPHLSLMSTTFETDDRGPVASPGTIVATNNSDAGYLATLGIPILAGRAFGPEDVLGAPAATVISRALAELLWPGQSPLGRRFRVDEEPWLTVVGVAGNARNGAFDSDLGLFAMYRPVEQQPLSGWATLAVRTSGAPESCAPSLRAMVRRLLPEAPISEVRTAYQVIGDSNERVRFVTAVMASVAATALLLALIGVYAAFWYAVRQRTHELGVRVALGATPGDLSRMVLGDSARLAAVALAIGGPSALAAASLLGGMLYEVSPGDPATLAAVGLLLFGLALCAAFVPARHAARVDPLLALRHE